MKAFPLMILFLAIWPFSSGKDYHLTASNIVPAASGNVKVQKDDNGNEKLDIKVSNLADPTRLVPPEQVYVVWVRPSGGDAVKQGALSVDNSLDGELKVVTTSRNFDVFVTAEPSAGVSMPSGPEVLHTHIALQ